ncbi:MAG: LapA family protein [Pseudomonadota bacterium]
MLTRILTTLIAAAAAIILVVLALANRHDARLVLDPFNRDQPALEVTMPFFLFMMAALILGVAVGGLSTWFSQGKWRKTARTRTQEAMRWRGEAERLTRERDDHVAAARAFADKTPTDRSRGTTLAIAAGR